MYGLDTILIGHEYGLVIAQEVRLGREGQGGQELSGALHQAKRQDGEASERSDMRL